MPPKAIIFYKRLITGILYLLMIWKSESSFSQAPTASFTVNGNTGGCSPLTVQFINTSQNASTYQWDFGNGNTSSLVNPVTVYLSAGSFTVKLVAIASNGAKDSVVMFNYINTATAPTASFTASPTTLCVNAPCAFSNNSSNYTNCLWDFGDGTTSSQLNPVHQYQNAGQFTVTLIAYNGSAGCSDVKTRQQYITVNPKPSTTFTVNLNSTCNQSQIFSFTSNAVNTASWNWNFGDGTSSSQQNPQHQYASPGIYSVSLVQTSAQGCKDSLVQNNLVNVMNNPVPVINASALTGCGGLNVSFSTNVTNVASVLWDFGNGQTSTWPTASVIYYNSGTYPVNYSVVYSNGCSNAAAPVNITILPTPNFSVYPSSNNGCAPFQATFGNNALSQGSTFLYQFGDGTTSSQQFPTHIYSSPGIYYPSLTVTYSSGCAATVNTLWPVVVEAPDATFSANLLSGCPPLNVNFHSNSNNAGNQFLWNFGDGSSSTQQHPAHTYTANGNFTVSLQVTDGSGCVSTYTLPTPVSVNNSVANYNPPPPVTACAPFTINLADSSSGAIAWQWNFGDGTSSAQQSPTHTYVSPGTYTVSLSTQTNGMSCGQSIPNYSTFIIGGGLADFSFTTERCPPFTAYFNDSSLNAVSWFWEFGDGLTSTQQNPTHVYANPGSYTVSLTITTADGCSHTITHNYAVNFEPLSASPIASTTDSIPPYTVQFTANSQGATGWLWDFGDGTTSTLQNPVHTFTGMPPYTIMLTLSNDSCTFTYTYPGIEIGAGSVPLNEDSVIVHQPDPQYGCAPLTLHFHNPRIDAVSWLWDFGDGGTSTAPNPVHVYGTPGTFDLTLILTTSGGVTDTIIKPGAVTVAGVKAAFSWQNSTACNGNTISIANHSSNATQYAWNFGDGTTSALQNPVHTYTNTGVSYLVTLIASDSSGCSDFAAQAFYGIPGNAVNADKRIVCAGDTVNFTGINLNYSSFNWDFGDGTNSSTPNPYHIYTDAGFFQAALTVSDNSGCQQTFSVPFLIEVKKPVAAFSDSVGYASCSWVNFHFQNQSTGSTQWLWDFGDGTFAANQHPMHKYTTTGNFQVKLSAFDGSCRSDFIRPAPVIIPAATVDFGFQKSSDCLPITVSFSDSSASAVSWLWEFGDGTTSVLQNPVHTFLTKPLNDVRLSVTNLYGCQLNINKPVIDPTMPHAVLSGATGCAPLTVTFSDSSANATSVNWYFGDGTQSSDSAGVHVYQQPGFYTISLVAISSSGCMDSLVLDSAVYVTAPKALFSFSNTGTCAPAIINFTDQSQGATGWFWNFGDSSFSTSQHPVHIYNTPGNFSVSLTVSDSIGCADSITLSNPVNVTGPLASFAASATSGCVPLSVSFQNQSANALSYFWNFGDGDTSAQMQVQHQYASPGNYIVTLIARDSSGCESVFTLPDTIRVFQSSTASFALSDTAGCAPFQVSLINSSQNAVSYYWNFGNGSFSTAANPSITFSVPGTYSITLITDANTGCGDTAISQVTAYEKPVAGFTGTPTEGCAPLLVQFQNQTSQLSSPTYQWTFSNGFTSTQQNPVSMFFNPGFYDITLVVNNENICSDTLVKTTYIKVYDNNPPPNASILSASVKSDTEVEITWQNVSDPDVFAYDLFRLNSTTNVYQLIYSVVDTGSSGFNVTSSFTDNGLNTLHSTYQYKIQTRDHCGNKTDLNLLTAHRTINVDAVTAGSHIDLSWNDYGGCPVLEYEIYRTNGSGGFIKIGSVPGNVTVFMDSTAECPVGYQYQVRATGLCGTIYFALSDTTAAVPESELVNQWVDAVFATVINDHDILTEWEAPMVLPEKVIHYDIFRSVDKVNYEYVASVDASEKQFTDTDVKVHEQQYYYLIKPVNTCRTDVRNGLISSSILLKSFFDEVTEDTRLEWTPYENWQQGVNKYEIQRKIGESGWETIRETDGNTLQFTDPK